MGNLSFIEYTKETMKYAHRYALLLILVISTSCERQNKTANSKENVRSETKNTVASPGPSKEHIHIKYVYADPVGEHLIIENSFPKGGLRYTDPKGNVYVYAIFWTRITNETSHPFELAIDFPADSFELPAAAGSHFRILLPADTMTHKKEELFDYGLPVSRSLDKALQKPASLKKIIHPDESDMFYVVAISDKGSNNPLRTGLSLKGQDLFYKINDKEIYCGKINLEKLKLQE